MMNNINLIVIDTVSFDLKIAISIGEKEFFIDKKDYSNQNVESLMPIIDTIFKEQNLFPNIITNIAVCVGPGSFTGIRVGLATAFGLIFGKNIDIIGFSQFDIYKALLKDKIDCTIIPIIDAKKDSVYTCFISDKISDKIEDEKNLVGECLTINELSDRLNSIDGKVYFTGKDFLSLKDRIVGKKDIIYEYCYIDDYSSKDMFYVIKKRISNGENGILEPLYLRKSDAEISLLNR